MDHHLEEPTQALLASTYVGDWCEPLALAFVCPGGTLPPEPCDCGFVGPWEYRWVHVWADRPGTRRTDRAVRADLAMGWPPRSGAAGYYEKVGIDERCPGCGDIERFDLDHELVDQRSELAPVLVLR